MQKELRHYRNTLRIAGGGVILFAVWDLLKTILLLSFNNESLRQALKEAGEYKILLLVFFLLIISLFLWLIVGVHLYVGRAARAEAAGKKPRQLYRVVAALLLISTAISIGFAVVSVGQTFHTLYQGIVPEQGSSNLLDSIVSILVDLTSGGALLDLLHASAKVHALQKAQSA